MDPPAPEERWLAYHYTKLGRWTYFGRWTPLGIKHRCLEYCYTKLGRQTYINQWIPQHQRRDDLHTTTQNSADEPTLANGTPTVPEERGHAYHYTKLGRKTYINQWTPQYQRGDDLHTITQNLADEHTLADEPLWGSSIDVWNTATPKLAGKPTLTNGPPSTRKEMTCIPLHKTWQMNILWQMNPPGDQA